jgi:DHA3 family tetracycline resistance protein-like MFS transporter
VREALRHRDFRNLFAGQAVSSVGDQIFPIAVTVHVLDNGGTVGDLGLILASRTAALVLFALLGGVWADRLPRVRVLIGADALRLVAVLGLILAMTGTTSSAALAGLVFFVGAGEAFFRPAYGALIPSVLPDRLLPAGNALSGVSFHVAAIVGPGLAGILVALVGSKGALVVDATTFGFSLAMLLRVREPGRVIRPRQRVHTEIAEGIAAVRSRRWIGAVLLMAMVQLMLLVPAVTLLLPKAVKDSGAATATYGYVLAISAVGGLVGAVLAARVRPQRPGLVSMLLLLPFSFEPLALLADAPLWVLTACWFLASFGLGPFLVYWETALQRDVPTELLARVISLDWMCSFALMPVGLALVGPAVDAFGRDAVLWVAVVAGIVPPLLCLPVPGLVRFSTPAPEPATSAARR